MIKKILGLDLGTNSIGWALVEINHKTKIVKILGLGSRIIPMDAGEIKDFESKGKIKSTAAQRTEYRGTRRLIERFKLRRDRLHLVLNLLNSLPEHYKLEIEFENKKGKRSGKFKNLTEPKLAYLPKQKGGKAEFLFKESYQEMLDELGIENKKGNRIPYDWTLYYLRDKALKTKEQLEKENKKPLTLEEFAWVLLSYNQKRGYEKTEVLDQSTKENEIVEQLDLEVISVTENKDEKGKYYQIQLNGNDSFIYKEYSEKQMTFVGDLKEVVKISKVDEEGNIDKKKTEFKVIDIYALTISDVDYKKEEGKHIYTINFHNGWKETKQPKKYTPKYKNVVNNEYDYIVETTYNHKGELKPIQKKERKLREPDFGDNSNDWTLLKKKTEKEALVFNADNGFKSENGSTKKYISPKIYDILKDDAKTGKRTKIIGGMFQVVDRDFYREELNDIVVNQQEIYEQLKDKDKSLIKECVQLLYPQNEQHRKALIENTNAIQHLLVEDVLLYQRPLKSKKSEIGNCKYEVKYWRKLTDKKGNVIEEVNTETGEIKPKLVPVYQKVVSASHPYYQEFRIWDKLHNLKIIQLEKEVNGKKETNQDVTKEYIKTAEDWQKLFDKLNNQKSLNQNKFLDFCKTEFKLPYSKKESNFVWNYPEDEELKGNETRVSFAIRFKRNGFKEYQKFLTQEKEYDLWHYLYSVSYQERNANDKKSLHTFFNRFFKDSNVDDEIKSKIIEDFANYPKFPSKYGAYSEKALKKLLPLINFGTNKSYRWENEDWYKNWKNGLDERKQEIIKRLKTIDFNTDKIDYSQAEETNVDLVNKEIPFPKGLFNAFKDITSVNEFEKLNLTKASYLIYGRHSELAQAKFWTTPQQIRDELHQELKHNSLNNPIAEKVLLEMMQIVADIWEDKKYGKGEKNYFNEIHIEVGRELKKSAKQKEKVTKQQSENKKQNNRLRQVLEEFLSESKYGANPKNSDHFERLKIAEEGAAERTYKEKDFFKNEELIKGNVTGDDIKEILNKPKINKSDFEKYKLWIEQGYKSPYSGEIISLTNLFDGNKYNIDHIFPQAKITNNLLSNKVVCEREINKEKSNLTGRAFIQNKGGSEIFCSAHNKKVKVLDEETYISIVKKQFSGPKRKILLAKEIPSEQTNSQLNNTKYIARKAMELLSHIVREEGEVEFRSKNVLPVTGAVTNELKKAWRLNEVWRDLVQPRFERMNKLTKSDLFGQWEETKSGHKYFNCNIDKNILEKNPSFDIKRIDHRHHALDALIIALCTQEHVNYINNINANAKSENFGKQKQIEKYRETLKRKIKYSKPNKKNPKENDWFYLLPGEKRKEGAENSKRESVVQMIYAYKGISGKEYEYKNVFLSALQDTIATFKQNLRVINKRVNYYKNAPNNITWQEPRTFKDDSKSENKYNWGVRRSLGKATYYGRVNLKRTEKKKLNSVIKFIFEDIDVIVNKELKKEIKQIKLENNDLKLFTKAIKNKYPKETIVDVYYFTDDTKDSKKIAIREALSDKFDSKKIKTITDTGIQKILLNHLKQFDTVELPFNDAIKYYDALLEKDEFDAIVKDSENDFSSVDELINYLKDNNYKFNKTDYKTLNIYIEKVNEIDFRNNKTYKITEHPEIAYTPEEIERMNQPENLQRLNNGKKHTPIKKVRISRGFGNQRPLNNNPESVKSKQYVVNDAGSNLYLGVYEGTIIDKNGNKVRKRMFKDIGLMDLIEILKHDPENRFHPLPKTIFDDKQNEYKRIFTLSPLDLVYVPTEEEIENQNFDIYKLDKNRIYKYVDGGITQKGGEKANFVPYSVSQPIWKFYKDKDKKEIFDTLAENGKLNISLKELIKDEFGLGSQQTKNQKSIDDKMIKNICWKLKVDRLGNISLEIIKLNQKTY